MKSKNLGKSESRFRILIATVLIVIGTHTYWTISILGIFILFTGIYHYCPLYNFLNIDHKQQRQKHLLSQLPYYNPQPVFIFNQAGKLEFSNSAAKRNLGLLNDINHFFEHSEHSIQSLINQNKHITNQLQLNETTYVLTFQGVSETNSISVYATDISDIIKANQEVINTQKEVVYTMGEIGERRSKETGNHVRRVAEYSELLALAYGLDQEQAELLKMASPMHDIGKIAIPDAILNKPGRLDKNEFEIMKTHAQIGFEMLNHSDRPILKAAAIVAAEHHEKYNGQGYPKGLKGKEIHIFARITAIADVFDALGSDRVYKKAWDDQDIFDLFEKEKGQHFDPILIELFFENLEKLIQIRKKYSDKQ